MKLKGILIQALTFAATLTGCVTEVRPTMDEIRIDKSFIGIAPEGGTVKTMLFTTGDWEITGLPEKDNWLTVTPLNGQAGKDIELTFSAEAYEGGARELNLSILCLGKEQKITVRQSPGIVKPKIYTIEEVLAFTENEIGKTIAVKGTIARITGPQYGELYLKDDKNNELLVYNCQPSFDEFKPAVGDIITVEGPFTIYKGTYELNKGSKITAIERSLIQLPQNEFEMQKEGGELRIEAVVKGESLMASVDYDGEQSGWFTYSGTQKADDKTIIVFEASAYNEKKAPRKATVTLTTPNGETESVAAFTVLQYGVTPDVTSIADALKTDYAKVQGSVAAIHSDGYVLADDSGAILVYKPEGFSLKDCKVGDRMEIVGDRITYNFGPQLEESWHAMKLEEGTFQYPEPEVLDAEALAALLQSIEGKDGKKDLVVEIKYITAEGTLAFSGDNDKYKNLSIEGAEKGDVSLYNVIDAFNVSDYKDKKVKVNGYTTSISGGSHVNIVVTSIEEIK